MLGHLWAWTPMGVDAYAWTPMGAALVSGRRLDAYAWTPMGLDAYDWTPMDTYANIIINIITIIINAVWGPRAGIIIYIYTTHIVIINL